MKCERANRRVRARGLQPDIRGADGRDASCPGHSTRGVRPIKLSCTGCRESCIAASHAAGAAFGFAKRTRAAPMEKCMQVNRWQRVGVWALETGLGFVFVYATMGKRSVFDGNSGLR